MHFIDIVDTVTATVTATSPAHPLYLSVSIPPFKSYPLDVTLESLNINLLITARRLNHYSTKPPKLTLVADNSSVALVADVSGT